MKNKADFLQEHLNAQEKGEERLLRYLATTIAVFTIKILVFVAVTSIFLVHIEPNDSQLAMLPLIGAAFIFCLCISSIRKVKHDLTTSPSAPKNKVSNNEH